MSAPARDEILTRSLNHWVGLFRMLPTVKTRTRELTRLIGPPSADAAVLHRRALLVTRLGVAGLWPSNTPRT